MIAVPLLLLLCSSGVSAAAADYFPPPDSEGGWRRPANAKEAQEKADIDVAKLDRAFAWTKLTTKHGGLLVARNGWLVYERYFGRGHADATPNNASVGKSFASIAAGILMAERPELFPQGLDQKVFTPDYFGPEMFPLSDPRRAAIRLGHLLAMSAGIRGNNPGIVNGKEVTLDPIGPDGWQAMVDEMATGKQDIPYRGATASTRTLWCEPGGGYSYATVSPHLVSMMIRHITGMEFDAYAGQRIAQPLGWGQYSWGYRQQVQHASGGGGVSARPPDMLRFAYLLLRNGKWKDRQIVPREYVQHCSRPSPYNPHAPYSLQFDVNGTGQWKDLPRDLFWKTGSGGHAIFVIPSLDLVVYKLGGRDEQYEPRNTGLEPAPGAPEYDGSRDGWKMGTDVHYEETYAETIRRVVAAVKPR
jgi:CubicO group peptidase (beta-lactamase class C family)